MPPEEKGEYLLDLQDKLEELFQKQMDLLTNQPIKNPFLKENVERIKLAPNEFILCQKLAALEQIIAYLKNSF